MASDEAAERNPHTGRSRSSTLSGSFGPITPNPPSSQQQRHERRASFLGGLLGFGGAGAGGAAAWPSSAVPAAHPTDGSSPASSTWGSPTGSFADTSSTAASSAAVEPDDYAKMRTHSVGGPLANQTALTAGEGGQESSPAAGPFGSWGRAASWMADKTAESPTETRRHSYFRVRPQHPSS